MRRRGFKRDDIHRLRSAYHALFLDEGVFRDRLVRVERNYAGDALVESILAFIKAGHSRPLMHPALSDGAAGATGSTDTGS
jgi:UDP-N-acetylglucosamine acyltransferase